LRGVGVEGARGHVETVGRLIRPGLEESVDGGADTRVGGEAGALLRPRHQDVAVYEAALAVIGAVEAEPGVAPQGNRDATAEGVLSGWQDTADLKETAGGEDGVGVGIEEITVERGLRLGR